MRLPRSATPSSLRQWPTWGSKRVEARFYVERHATRGDRAVRVTTGAPKKLTYAWAVRIVDGDDGKTYILEYSAPYRHVTVMQSNMKYQHEVIHDSNPRYEALLDLLKGNVERA
jgi:hypothetical protein